MRSESLKPIIEIQRCPKCDAVAGAGMVYCSACGYVLDEKLRLEAGQSKSRGAGGEAGALSSVG